MVRFELVHKILRRILQLLLLCCCLAEMELFALVEGQTLLHGGRFRFLRRIGSGTFAVILRCVFMVWLRVYGVCVYGD